MLRGVSVGGRKGVSEMIGCTGYLRLGRSGERGDGQQSY